MSALIHNLFENKPGKIHMNDRDLRAWTQATPQQRAEKAYTHIVFHHPYANNRVSGIHLDDGMTLEICQPDVTVSNCTVGTLLLKGNGPESEAQVSGSQINTIRAQDIASLDVHNNPTLQRVDIHNTSPEHETKLTICNNPELSTLSVDSLFMLSCIKISNNPKLRGDPENDLRFFEMTDTGLLTKGNTRLYQDIHFSGAVIPKGIADIAKM